MVHTDRREKPRENQEQDEHTLSASMKRMGRNDLC
jgi:hypothetical protein